MANHSEKLDKLLQDVATIKADVYTVKRNLDSLEVHVFTGNGKPSLLARVEVNEAALSELKWLKRAAIGGIATGIFGLLLAVAERFWS